MKIHQLKSNFKSKQKRKRVGRGGGSGIGNYSGRGGKGQTARTGGNRRPGFEGGQTPIYRRMPKLGGFKNPTRIEYTVFNVGTLAKYFQEGETVSLETLVKKKLIRSTKNSVKILGEGEITIPLTIQVQKISKSAVDKITKAGGRHEAERSDVAQRSRRQKRKEKVTNE